MQVGLALVSAMLIVRLFRESLEVDEGAPVPPKPIQEEELAPLCDDPLTANKIITERCNNDIMCVVENKAKFDTMCSQNVMPGGLLDDESVETEYDTETDEEIEDEEEEE